MTDPTPTDSRRTATSSTPVSRRTFVAVVGAAFVASAGTARAPGPPDHAKGNGPPHKDKDKDSDGSDGTTSATASFGEASFGYSSFGGT